MVFEGSSIDIALHGVTVIVSLILGVVSVNAYAEKKNSRFLYLCLAFTAFAIKEALLTANIIYFTSSLVTGTLHVLNLIVLALFFTGMIQR
jgi:hypothetical protein